MVQTRMGPLLALLLSCYFTSATEFIANIYFEGNFGDRVKVLLMDWDSVFKADDCIAQTEAQTGETYVKLRGFLDGDELGMDYDPYILVGRSLPGNLKSLKCYKRKLETLNSGRCGSDWPVCEFNVGNEEITKMSYPHWCRDEIRQGV